MGLSIRTLDLATLAAYLSGILALGAISARRGRKVDNYFVGGRNFPGWVVALSMLGTIVSSTTFLALPAAAFVLDWRQLSVNLMVPFIALLAAYVFIPFFRRGGLTSAFEYLGDRFGPVSRGYAAASFVVLQQIRVAQVLFLVSLPVQFLTGVPIEWVIVGSGIFVALYTIAGGMETVIWAGMAQALLMLCGGLVCLLSVALHLPGGFAQVIEVGCQQGKFSLGSFKWDLGERTFWTVAILGLVHWLTIYSGDQTMVQRYVSARSLPAARKATLLFAGIALPMWTMFFFIGTALYVYFHVVPDPMLAQMEPDQVLPYFVLKHIPAGVAGLVIAGVIAAAMSSLDSGVNSIASVVVVDMLRPHLAKGRTDEFYLNAARWTSGVVIFCMVLGALAFVKMRKESMNDVSLIVASVLGGALAGLYLVGFFTQRVDSFAANTALALALGVNAYLGLSLLDWLPGGWAWSVHSYWVGALVNLAFILAAYGISWLRRPMRRDLTGLTVWTLHGPPSAGVLRSAALGPVDMRS